MEDFAKDNGCLEYEIPMRQKLYALTRMAMDLVNELRRLSSLNAAGQGVIISLPYNAF